MPEIIVYSGPNCPYCQRAKMLLTKKGAAFTEYDIRAEPGRLDEMKTKSGGKQSIPQIFIGGRHIGGCDDLYALDGKGQLDALLSA